ncbi:unnamed protein product [Zymoseptoria tritici ST99CH_1A5]|uniref:Uncharacterized protein n=2 Tax=Zymoseptoria tritici TaxID=1047171 RepID=A0A1X7RD68_ZYMT9|nr:unnamed protein product [Zymoseptoria tritici ST99CH_3D7]SMR43905.1 unnamed protein product [Zymoseptoria tritici ST99CH_3D1]SMY19063.1 unnamed protein product [Zymoseptoria tritici ST99CH_1A5]
MLGTSANLPESKTDPRGLKTTSPVKDIFRASCVDGALFVLSVSDIIAMLCVAAKAERTSNPSFDVLAFTRNTATQRHFTTLQILQAAREGVASEEMHLLFDYFGLHQRAYTLLDTLRRELDGEMLRYFGPNYIEDYSQLPYMVGYIFDVAHGSDRVAEELRIKHNGSEMLLRASEIVAKFLEGEAEESKGSYIRAKSLAKAAVGTNQS